MSQVCAVCSPGLGVLRGTIQRGENSTDQDDWKHKAMSPAHLCLRARNLNNTQKKADIMRKRRTPSAIKAISVLRAKAAISWPLRKGTKTSAIYCPGV